MLATGKQVVRCQWVAEAFKSFLIRPSSVPPRDHVARHDLNHARIVVTEPEIHEVTNNQPSCLQQFGRYTHLPNLCDLVRAVWHGCMHDLINFNSIQVMAWMQSEGLWAPLRPNGGELGRSSHSTQRQGTGEQAARISADETTYVEGVRLLGIRVAAVAAINAMEHDRRQAAGCGAVTDPALLGRLLGLPLETAVSDPVVWAETADQPTGVIDRDAGGVSVTRHLAAPLAIEDVIVVAPPGRELRAVQDLSMFVRFTRRWVVTTRRRIPDPVVLEAKLCGVGILDAAGEVLASEAPPTGEMDSWDWMLREQVYRKWLSQSSRDRATVTPAQATGGASATPAS